MKQPTADLLARLDSLWHEYKSQLCCSGEKFWAKKPNTTDARVCLDAFTSMTVSYFDCARLMLVSILGIVSQDCNHTYTLAVTRACESILSCATFIATHDIGCAYLRVMFPLVLVYSHSPSMSHKDTAYSMLHRGQSQGKMSGASAMALPRSPEHSDG